MSDDRDDFRRGRSHAALGLSQQLRRDLASVGIDLEDPAARSGDSYAREPPVEIDRAAIRAYLEPLGAPEWAIVSCPSLVHARTFRPRKRKAYPPSAR